MRKRHNHTNQIFLERTVFFSQLAAHFYQNLTNGIKLLTRCMG